MADSSSGRLGRRFRLANVGRERDRSVQGWSSRSEQLRAQFWGLSDRVVANKRFADSQPWLDGARAAYVADDVGAYAMRLISVPHALQSVY